MAHSNQLREFVITGKGIKLIPPYIGPGGALTGTSRINQEAKEKLAALQRGFEISRKQREVSRKRRALEAQAASLQAELVTVDREAEDLTRENKKREQQARVDQAGLAKSRSAN